MNHDLIVSNGDIVRLIDRRTGRNLQLITVVLPDETIQDWHDDRCVAAGQCKSLKLYVDYMSWCVHRGRKFLLVNEFSNRIAQMYGVTSKRTKNGILKIGISLKNSSLSDQ